MKWAVYAFMLDQYIEVSFLLYCICIEFLTNTKRDQYILVYIYTNVVIAMVTGKLSTDAC